METNTVKHSLVTLPLPADCRVIYLRDKLRRPVACIVYKERLDGDKVKVEYNFSSLAKSDQNKKVTPNLKFGRTVALQRLMAHRHRERFNLEFGLNDMRKTKSGLSFLMKEALLERLLDTGSVSASFRSKIKNHLSNQMIRQTLRAQTKDNPIVAWADVSEELLAKVASKLGTSEKLVQTLEELAK